MFREPTDHDLSKGTCSQRLWPGSCSLGTFGCTCGEKRVPWVLWMDEILHHFETMRSHCLLAFTRGSSFQAFLGAGFCPSTVWAPNSQRTALYSISLYTVHALTPLAMVAHQCSSVVICNWTPQSHRWKQVGPFPTIFLGFRCLLQSRG